MAEGQVLIKDLPEATTVEDSSYIPVDNGSLTQKISVENFNNSSNRTAKAYAEQAQAAATTATEAIADVNSKVDAAQAQANIAATQAGYAQTYAGNAQTYAGNAQGYANTAQGSATNAAASASAASSSADAANDNATLARSWAEGNTGAREGENTNNARYWANKAESAAQITIDPTLDPSSTNPVENRAIYEAINAIHTGGSNITITTTETSLRGKDCVLTDGTTSYTKTFDLTGKALFEGVQMTGNLTISATDGTQTATGSINVPYFGNYSKSIAFWRATIDVTSTTTQFNGLTVSAKKNGVVMGSGTFNTDYGKNFLENTATTQTINGVTFTVNDDGSVTVNGTATSDIIETIGIFNYVSESLTLTGCPSDGAWNTYRLDIRNENNIQYENYLDTGNGVTFTPDENYTYVCLRIGNRATVSNLTFYPMLRRADIIDPTYEPYHDPITSASITVPEAGTYNLEVTLDWKTYTSSPFSVTEETTYNETIDGYIAPISLTTPTSEFYGQSISVTRNGVALPVSLAFDNTGAATFTALDSGSYVFTLTYGGEPYTATVTVEAATTYSAVIKMWTATVNISTTSSVLQLQQIVVKKSGVQVGTTQFNAAGTASYIAHEAGTYTFECTYDSYPFSSDPVAVSDETTYSTTITAFTATLNISTTSAELYSRPITIQKGSSTVGTTAFSSSGSATYRVHEPGIYTLTCDGYDASATVTTETTYPVSILAGLDLASWISAGSTTEHPLNPSSYADFAALEADEAAIRQLMTVHASVDYLAQATAGDSLMQSVINSNVCAKWINLRDYALDTLYANNDIADVMDTADKYFYGEWVIVDSTTTPPTWGAKGNVPIMTSNSAPYGTAGGTANGTDHPYFYAFDGNDSTWWGIPQYSALPLTARLHYGFVNPIDVKKAVVAIFKSSVYDGIQVKIQYSDDGTNWEDATAFKTRVNNEDVVFTEDDFTARGYHLYWAAYYYENAAIKNFATTSLQFYGREMKPISLVNNGSASSSGGHYSADTVEAKAFDGSTSTKWMSVGGSLQEYIAWTFPKNTKVEYISIVAGSGSYSPSVLNSLMAVKSGSSSLETIKSNVQLSGANPTLIDISDADSYAVYQFYIPTKLAGGSYYTEMAEIQFFAFDYSEKEFAPNSGIKYLYDHGVKLVTGVGGITGGSITETDTEIVCTGVSSGWASYWGADSIDLSQYDTIRLVPTRGATSSSITPYLGIGSVVQDVESVSAAAAIFDANNVMLQSPDNFSLDVSNVNESKFVFVSSNAGGMVAFDEWWLE